MYCKCDVGAHLIRGHRRGAVMCVRWVAALRFTLATAVAPSNCFGVLLFCAVGGAVYRCFL
eukprot:1145898-Pelagomonas_calceolata.AAC.4